jgi:hypothetical protein
MQTLLQQWEVLWKRCWEVLLLRAGHKRWLINRLEQEWEKMEGQVEAVLIAQQ